MAKEKRQQKLSQTTRERQRIETLVKAPKRERGALEVIMENTGAYLAYLNSNFNFDRINFAYTRDSGHTLNMLIGPNHFSLFHDTENQAIFEIVRVPLSSLPYLW